MNFQQGQSFEDVVGVIINLINLTIPLLAAVAIVLFLAGVVRFLMHAADSRGKQADKELMFWGLVGLFVLFSLWGIIWFLMKAFGIPLSGSGLT